MQKTAGAFTLTADANFGANYGLLSKYFSTRTANPATAGLVRLAVTDTIAWRNNANNGNLLLAIDGSNNLVFNGTSFISNAITALTGDVTATGPGIVAATVAAIQGTTVSGTTGTGNVAFSASPTFTGTALAAAITASGTVTAGLFSGPLTGNVTGNVSGTAATFTGNLTGDVTSVAMVTTLTNAPVIAKVLTGYTSGAGTVSATDSILQAIQKLNGNVTALTTGVSSVFTRTGAVVANTGDYTVAQVTGAAPLASPTFSGTVVVPTPFTIGAVSMTATGTQLNYLAAATGTTGTTSTNLVFSTSPTLISPALGTPTALVGTNITGTAAGLTAGTCTTIPNLTGEVTSSGNVTTVTNAAVIGKVITGYVSGAGTVAATDTILQAINKLNGNIVASVSGVSSVFGRVGAVVAASADYAVAQVTGAAPLASPTFTGTVTVPTPFTIGAVSMTATGTQLNYLAAATGTTGTTSTNIVFSTSPTFITPVLGAASATSINKMAITAPSSASTLAVADGKTFTVSNTLTLTATDSSTLAIGTGGTLGSNAYTSTAYAPLASPTFTGTVTVPTPFTIGAVSVTTTGTILNLLTSAGGTTGTTSTNIVFSTSPTLVTPALGTPSALVLTNATGAVGANFGTQTAGTFFKGPNSGSAANPSFAALQVPTIQKFTANPTGATNYTFTITAGATASVGATYTNNGQTFTLLAALLVGDTVLYVSGTGTPAASGTLTYASGTHTAGNITFSAFSGAYVLPAGVLYLEIELSGAGGGGGGTGTASNTSGGTGGTSTFGTLSCTGGVGGGPGSQSNSGNGGAGGTVSGSPNLNGVSGGTGNSSSIFGGTPTANVCGNSGGNNPLGGAGQASSYDATGVAGATNTGGGGSGGGGNTSTFAAGGGGAGAYLKHLMGSPSSFIAWSVGPGGTAGAIGTSGRAGGLGGSGSLTVKECYQ